MEQTAPSPAQTTLPTDIIRRRFTVDDYDRMAEAGILHEDDRVELIDGEIVQLAASGPRHATSVDETVYNLVPAYSHRRSARERAESDPARAAGPDRNPT